MPSFKDFVPDQQFDYDVTPEETIPRPGEDPEEQQDLQPLGETVPDDPGAGDTFQGSDPTVFDEQNEWTDEQSADRPAQDQVGTDDDPEAQEQVSDEAAGQDEVDTPLPEQVDAGRDIDATDEVRYLEQGQDKDEVTNKEPAVAAETEPAVVDPYEELLAALLEAADTQPEEQVDARSRGQQLRRIREWLDRAKLVELDFRLWLMDQGTDMEAWDAEMAADLQVLRLNGGNFPVDYFEHKDAFRAIFGVDTEEDFEDVHDLVEMAGAEDLFTTPALLADFGDIVGGVDQDTFLQEFQFLNADDS